MDSKIKNLRDALEWLDRDINEEAAANGEMSNADAIRVGFIRNMLKKFPLRNCDVGTPSERTDRYVAFCNSHTRCADCPCDKIDGDCEFSWGDMPYKKGANNGK